MIDQETLRTSKFGIVLMLCAFLCFAVMDTSAKWLVTATISAFQVAFFRYLFHFVWVLVLYLPKHGTSLAKSGTPRLQALRACVLLFSTTLNFTALKYLPLTTTIAIFFAVPMLVCLLSIPVLGEKVGIKRFAAVVVGFAGVLIIVQPWGQQFDIHVLYSLGALVTAAGYFILTRLIAGVDTNAVTQFYTSAIPTIALSPFAFVYWQWPESSLTWVLVILLGTLGMLGHSLVTRAHHYAEASLLSPVVYSQIIYITILGWLVFGSVPSMNTMIGVAVIIASGVYIWRREQVLADASKTIMPRERVLQS